MLTRAACRMAMAVVLKPLPAHRRALMSGLGDKMKGWAERKQAQTMEAQFKEQIHSLSETVDFTMDEFQKTVRKQARQAGAVGWRSLLPGSGKAIGAKEAEDVLRIMDVMTADEKAAGVDLQKEAKVRIAQASATEVSDVNLMLRKYSMLQAMHAWIRHEKALGNPLPETQSDLHAAIVRRPLPKPSNPVLRKRRR